MSRAIDGDKLFEYIQKYEMLKIIQEKPTMQNESWIPVSERLPDKAGEYIGTVKFEDGSIGTYPVWFHNGIRTDVLWEMDDCEVNVIAWQPKPEPWKEVAYEKNS